MLSNRHHYHRIIRKLVVAFGTMFNEMRLVKYDKTGTTEIERINVPLMYASKEKFYARIAAAPDPYNPVNLTLPRMAFEMNGISYDPLRKKSNFVEEFGTGGSTGLVKARMTPYNFDFNLYIFVRNTEDGAQIVEQILPYFTPDYTVTLNFVGVEDFNMDVPIVFNSITYDDSHEGDPESTRSIIWTLNFTAKGYLFGPIANASIIKKATANIHDMTFETSPLKELELTGGQGDYKIDEAVYQGTSIVGATATGFVRTWRSTSRPVYEALGTVDAANNIVTQNTAVFTGNIEVGNVITMNSETFNVTNVINASTIEIDSNIANSDLYYINTAIGTVDSANNIVTENTAIFVGNVYAGNVISMDSNTYNVVSVINASAIQIDSNVDIFGTILIRVDEAYGYKGISLQRIDTAYSNTIILYDTDGTFTIGNPLVGAVTGARWNVASFAIANTQLVNISVEPTPNTANTEAEAFGFSVNITEYV